jgi:hypothetical protein
MQRLGYEIWPFTFSRRVMRHVGSRPWVGTDRRVKPGGDDSGTPDQKSASMRYGASAAGHASFF